MTRGDKVQFIRDVTWQDLIGPSGSKEIVVEIWSIGTVQEPENEVFWATIDVGGKRGYGFPPDCFEIIPPSPQ